ncbi:MAG: fructose-1,6-bisphosphatase/inositol monophosphatase family enzyme [Paracrocinitomix sp.]|jgi:fructose-1,6-bisphosphatase/inositol monophosphatase family enzyme
MDPKPTDNSDVKSGPPTHTGPMLTEPLLIANVAAAIREVGNAEVVPRFRSLAAGDITEKGPGDLVTIADQECERVLSERLRTFRDIPVVGEEATAADPSLLDLVAGAPAVWVTDPIDGTSNFVAGNPNFVVMVSLVEYGVTEAAWVWHPETDLMLTAERGKGLSRNGEPAPTATRSDQARGILKRKFMDEPARTRLGSFPQEIGELVPAHGSAGIEYAALIDGRIDFLMYWRTLPWDHSPGGLLAQEAGMRVARPDGSPYLPGDGKAGLLAATPELWDLVAAEIQAATSD